MGKERVDKWEATLSYLSLNQSKLCRGLATLKQGAHLGALQADLESGMGTGEPNRGVYVAGMSSGISKQQK